MFWLLLVLALIAAAIIAVVLFRHWKEIRLLDPDTIRAEQERKVRDRIVRQRFDRRLRHMAAPLQRSGRHLLERMTDAYRQAEQKLAQAVRPHGSPSSSSTETQEPEDIRVLLEEGERFVEEGRWAEAERAYLELLKRDQRNLRAWRGLGELYLHQRQYPQARETFLFLQRIQGCDDACYAGLALIAEADGNEPDAETYRKRAVEQAPKNGLRHAELAAFYLAHGSPEYAMASAKRAADLSPDDPRCLEICTEAAILLRDRTEAERRYERLCEVSTDRARLQTLQDRINLLPVK